MPEGFWLSDTQWERLAPLLPNKPRGVARVDDRRVISGIVVALQSGGRWIDVPAEYGAAQDAVSSLCALVCQGGVAAGVLPHYAADSTRRCNAATLATCATQRGPMPDETPRPLSKTSELGRVTDNPDAPVIYCIDAAGFSIFAGVVTVTLLSQFWDHTADPSVSTRRVVGRLVMPAIGAHSLATQLFNFCEKQGIAAASPAEKERPQ